MMSVLVYMLSCFVAKSCIVAHYNTHTHTKHTHTHTHTLTGLPCDILAQWETILGELHVTRGNLFLDFLFLERKAYRGPIGDSQFS